MHESSTKKIYDIHSMFYDATFGRLVRRRIERAINHMNIAESDCVLDLGIGTGHAAAVTGRVSLKADGVRIVPVHHAGPAPMAVVVGSGSASLHTVAVADALAVLPADWTDGDPAIILAIP